MKGANQLLIPALFALALALAGCGQTEQASVQLVTQDVPQERFSRLATPIAQPAESPIMVWEIFSYGCPHCHEVDPVVTEWAKAIPSDVRFQRIALPLRAAWEPYARIFYAAEEMGVQEQLHELIFQAIHREGLNLAEEASLRSWLPKQGINAAKFLELMNSPTVQDKMQAAEGLAMKARLEGVPSFIVGGQYVTSLAQVGSYQDVPGVLNQMIARARSAP